MGLDIFTMATANAHTDEVAESFATGLASTKQNADGTIDITYTDGKTYTTPVVKGEKGDTGAQGPQGPKGADGSGSTYDDTEIRGLISALDTKVDNLFDMVDDINYITAETYATMTDPTTLEDGVYICLVKQDENYPKEGTECYSTLYICIVDDTPTWEFVGKLNVSEKTMESLITSGIATALTNYYTKAQVDALVGGSGNTYSTTETQIGTFLGKPLYRKIVPYTTPTTTGNQTIASGISVAVDNILRLEFIAKSSINVHFAYDGRGYGSSNFYTDDLRFNGESDANTIIFNIKALSASYQNMQCYFILEYTKTTDA